MNTAIAAFLILVGIVLAQRTAFFINIAASGKISSEAIKTLLGFSLIRYLPMLLTLTLFLSVLLTLSRCYRDSEMVVWFSSGMSISRWVRPILLFSAPIIVLIALLSLFVTPWILQKSLVYKDQLEAKDELSTITPGVFKESKHADRVFFVESFDELGNVVKNIFVQSTQHQRLGIINANSGHRETAKNNDAFLIMEKGRRYEGKPNTAEFTSTEFDRYAIRIEAAEVKQTPPDPKATGSFLLLKSKNAEQKAELQWRISSPIAALILVILAIPLSFVDPRTGRSANLMMAVFIYIIYNNLLSIMQAWLAQDKISPYIGLWPVHLVFIILGVYLFYRRTFELPVFPKLKLKNLKTNTKQTL